MCEFNNFKSICERVSSLPCTNNQLDLIKDYFRAAIDSPRRFDAIISLSGLIRLLEKRDVLNTEDVSPLSHIATALQRYEIIQIINNGGNNLHEQPPLIEPIHRQVLPEISQDPIRRVDDMICLEIGQKWNDLARHLDVPEGFIDGLECRYRRVSDMMREVLKHHRDNSDERYWKVNLCNALQKARRRDLSIRVQNTFALYGLM